MSFLTNAKMAANMAFSPIMAGARQAKSYAKPMATLGWSLSKQVITHATENRLTLKAGLGAAVGAAGGAGYASTDPRATAGSMVRAGIGGAILGGGVGAAYGIGRSAYGMRGSAGVKSFVGSARAFAGDMRSAGRSTVSNVSDMARYYSGAGADASMRSVASGLYGRGRSAAASAVNGPMGARVATAAGRTVGAVRGSYGWAMGMARY